MTMARKYDLIIFGASGYTGEWVVEECANLQKASSGFKPFTWAVAGRSERKLIETLRKVSDFVGELSIDSFEYDFMIRNCLHRPMNKFVYFCRRGLEQCGQNCSRCE